jgi:hypothetical protein
MSDPKPPASAPAPASPYDVAAARLAALATAIGGTYREQELPAPPSRIANLTLAAARLAEVDSILALARETPAEARPFCMFSANEHSTVGTHYVSLSVSCDLTPDEARDLAEVEAERAAS